MGSLAPSASRDGACGSICELSRSVSEETLRTARTYCRGVLSSLAVCVAWRVGYRDVRGWALPAPHDLSSYIQYSHCKLLLTSSHTKILHTRQRVLRPGAALLSDDRPARVFAATLGVSAF